MFTPLKKILPQIIARHQIKNQVEASVICEVWEKIKSQGVIRHAESSRALYFRDQQLYLEVDHHAIAQELLYQRTEIISQIKKMIPEVEIIDIRFIA